MARLFAGPGAGITSFVRHPDFVPGANPSAENDIAVISLAQPVNVTSVAPVKLLMLQPGQARLPDGGHHYHHGRLWPPGGRAHHKSALPGIQLQERRTLPRRT